MKNLKLLSKLQASEMVTLILKATAGERLDYYIIAQTINYSIVCTGQCEGTIIRKVGDERGSFRQFNILLSSVLPLIEKGHAFRIVYDKDVLRFVSGDDRLKLTPLCVEYNNPQADKIVSKYQRFQTALIEASDSTSRIRRAEVELESLQEQYNGVSLMHLDGEMQSSNPFAEDSISPKIDAKYTEAIKEQKEKLATLQQQAKAVETVDLKAFRTMTLAASRSHEMINFCDTFAVTALKNSFILQTGKCPTMAVQASLLYQLIQYNEGNGFHWFEGGLVFSVGEEERTVVFMEKYLPNTAVDSSIVTRGIVREKYILSMKGILSVTQLMRSKFPQMTFDLGNSKIILENDKGEVIETTFETEGVDTLQLKKLMRGENVQGEITQATLSIPSEVQSLLGMFRDKLTLYVKERKVIFQADSLYLVFGR